MKAADQPATAVAGIFAVFLVTPGAGSWLGVGPRGQWLLCLLVGAIALRTIGAACSAGVLTNEQGRLSLSRFQLVAWTWLILSTLWCFAVRRMTGSVDPLNLEIDQDIWLLLGINAASFAGACLTENERSDRDGAPPSPLVRRRGSVRDLFISTASADTVDLSRVQVWFFTVVTLIAYAISIWRILPNLPAALRFPPISEGMNALLAISHATYLANKVATLPKPPPDPLPVPPGTSVTKTTVRAETTELASPPPSATGANP